MAIVMTDPGMATVTTDQETAIVTASLEMTVTETTEQETVIVMVKLPMKTGLMMDNITTTVANIVTVSQEMSAIGATGQGMTSYVKITIPGKTGFLVTVGNSTTVCKTSITAMEGNEILVTVSRVKISPEEEVGEEVVAEGLL